MSDQVTLIRDPAAFAALAADWDACLATMPGAQPFLTHAWLSAWYAELGSAAQLRVFVLRRGGILQAAAPLCLRRGRYYGLPVRELVWLGDRTSDRMQFLARGEDPALVRDLWPHVAAHDEGQHLLRLEEVPADSATAVAVPAAGRLVAREPSSHLPRVAVGDWDAFEATLARKFKAELRTRTKLFADWGAWRLETDVGPAAAEQLARMAELETLSAKGTGGYAFLAQPANRRFLGRVLREPGPVLPVLLRLEVGDLLVAYLLCLAHGDALSAYNMAYRPGYEKGSPGKWLLHQAMFWANARGLAVFDFLRGAHDLKARWHPDERTNCRLAVFRAGVVGTLLHVAVFRARPRLKRWLSPRRARPR
ncbi:MAG: GNAT family N-acetyltransferase [Krumholzibacteria bacterium]|nr:GNAT family N-acetyltransferase [Candidatus Krumholzibacteria bacterium]